MSITTIRHKMTDDTEAARPKPASTDPTTGRNRLRIALAGLFVIALIALLVATVLFGRAYLNDRATDQTRIDAPDAAGRQAVAMLGYDFNNVDKELPKAADGLTGSFKDDYAKLIQTAIIPGAKEKQLTVKVTVQAAGVVSASPDSAVVLLFINQVTTGKETPQAVTTGSRVRVDMQKVDGRWLASGLTPI